MCPIDITSIATVALAAGTFWLAWTTKEIVIQNKKSFLIEKKEKFCESLICIQRETKNLKTLFDNYGSQASFLKEPKLLKQNIKIEKITTEIKVNLNQIKLLQNSYFEPDQNTNEIIENSEYLLEIFSERIDGLEEFDDRVYFDELAENIPKALDAVIRRSEIVLNKFYKNLKKEV